MDHRLTVQPILFDFLKEKVGRLDEKQRLFVRVAETLDIGSGTSFHARGHGKALFRLLHSITDEKRQACRFPDFATCFPLRATRLCAK